jgi:PAS domain S-box-containing protein
MKGPEGLPDRSLLARLVNHAVLLPLVVFALLLSATGFVWQEINRYHLQQQISDSNKHLEFVVVHLAAHLDVRMVLGELIRQEWLDYHPSTPEDFAAFVKPKLQRFPDIQAINWVDAEGVIRWINPVQGNEQALGLDIRKLPQPNAALSAAARTGEPQVTAPFNLAQGGRGFVVYIPVIHDGHLEGFINMVFRTETLIDTALTIEERRDNDLHIRDGDSLVYDNHKEQHLADERHRDLQVGNRVWAISVAPTVLNREAFSQASSHLLLLFGMLFSVALPLMLYQMLRRNAELRESQRRFADYADISSDWFWETDEHLRFSYFSQRFEEVSGVPPERFLGKTRREVGAPEADPLEYRKMLEQMDNHQPFRDFEHTRVKPDGSKAFLAISGRPAFDENGDFIGYRGVGKDITERKQSQKVLNDALLASEQANRAKSEFLATMSHEFRTPLNAIIGFSEMLKEEYFGKLGAPNYREYAADIHRSGRHMLDLVNDILDFSAIEASKRQMKMEDFSFADVLKDGVRNVENQIMQKGLTLKKELAEDLPLLHADKRSVYQVILNLLSNAVKFTGPDCTITVSARVEDGTFVFTIADTGTGIPADKLSSITEPFTQTHRDPHVSGTGTGLGLTIVKSLVEAHDGRLEVESTLGIGTGVTVILPQPAG